jgi:hypothetical protein
LKALVERQHLVKIKFRLAKDWNSYGYLGFYMLRTNARSAMPELIKIVDENISPDSPRIQASAKEASASLQRWAGNTNKEVSSTARMVLGIIDPDARPGMK